MIENNFIKRLLKEGDSEQLELMGEFDSHGVGATICGFLNTKGGRLIIGIDKKKNAHRIPAYNHVFEELNELLYEKLVPSSIILMHKIEYKNENSILIEVLEGSKKPYSYRNETFVRIGNKTKLANDDNMSLLIRNRRMFESSWERSLCLEASLEHLDISEISRSIEMANKVKRSSQFDSNNLSGFLQSTQLTLNQGLTNAAVVLYGKDPTYFLPQCSVRIVEFPEGKTGGTYSNTILIQDNLFRTFDEVLSYFKRSIPLVSTFDNSEWLRDDRLKYPLRALDEAVINALIHRDYSDSMGEVFIGIYPDRIEIINSGELPHFLSEATLKKDHKSIPPNPCITQVMFLCGIIEKVGRGTVLINNLFKEIGLPEPKWISKNGFTKLILYGEPKDLELNPRMLDFLKSLVEPQFSRQDYEDYFEGSIAEKTARNDLSKLLESGFITRTGKGASTRYNRTKKELPEDTG